MPGWAREPMRPRLKTGAAGVQHLIVVLLPVGHGIQQLVTAPCGTVVSPVRAAVAGTPTDGTRHTHTIRSEKASKK